MSNRKITAKYKVKNLSPSPFRVNVRNRESLVLAPGEEKLIDHMAFDAYTKSLKPWIAVKVIEVSPYVDEVKKVAPKVDPSSVSSTGENPLIPSRGGSQESTGTKFYTREELKTLSREDINTIAKSVGASPARSKDDLINNVLATQVAQSEPENSDTDTDDEGDGTEVASAEQENSDNPEQENSDTDETGVA